jgi:hypothetical protein
MAKNEIKVVSDAKINDRVNEREMLDEITKGELFDWFHQNGYSYSRLEEIFEGNRVTSNEQNHFNIILRKAKDEIEMEITDIILYLENEFSDLRRLMAIVDDETKHILKIELAANYKINVDKNSLEQILS